MTQPGRYLWAFREEISRSGPDAARVYLRVSAYERVLTNLTRYSPKANALMP